MGHSERRQHFGETDQAIADKASSVVNSGMTAIVCVGEDDNERQRRRAERYVRRQVRQGLAGIEDPSNLVIAYEPIWAIGTGVAATIGQIEYMAASIEKRSVTSTTKRSPIASELIRRQHEREQHRADRRESHRRWGISGQRES